jgi:hypothetical protein
VFVATGPLLVSARNGRSERSRASLAPWDDVHASVVGEVALSLLQRKRASDHSASTRAVVVHS